MPVLSSSDVRRAAPAGRVRVAGRILQVEPGGLSLADAFDLIAVEIDRPGDCSLGDLAIVEGVFSEGRLKEGVLVERWPSSSSVHAETERLQRIARTLRARTDVIVSIRSFFEHRGFLEVDTPALVPSPGLDLHLDAFGVSDVRGPSFRGMGYLSTSPEMQMKRLLAGGMPRIFQIARCFRRGEVGSRHNPEFTMLEWYRAFAGFEEVMDDTEALVKLVLGESVRVGETEVDLRGPFERCTVGEAFERFAGTNRDRAIEIATSDEDCFFRLLVDEVEPALARLAGPVFLTEFPAPFASLARLSPDDARVCERFELYVGGLELCNGFGELTDPKEQRARFERDQEHRKQRGKDVYPIDERFLAALEEGMPPSAGNALGVDRLVGLATGTPSIGDVQPFPFDGL